MSNRILMLDTETTGLEAHKGDKVIEIGLVEYEGLTATGRSFQRYINPGDRQIMAGATAVHGITNEMLADKPMFEEIVDELTDFINDDPIVIYNAKFDMGFLDVEYENVNRAIFTSEIIDALEIAKKRFPRSRLTLDSVARKFGVDVSNRELHGALLDADILGRVYKRLTQQDELAMADMAQQVISAPTQHYDSKPLLRVLGVKGLHLIRAETSYTPFSSTLNPETLVKSAKEAGYDSVCITDRYTIAGTMAFAKAAKKYDIKGIVGVGLDISSAPESPLIFYAQNEQGWKNLQKLITLRNVYNKGGGLTSEQLRLHSDGIVITCGGNDGAIATIFRKDGIEKAVKTAKFFSALYNDRFAIEISRNGAANEVRTEAGLTTIAYELQIPVLASSIARALPGDSEMVEVIKAIGTGSEYQPDFGNDEDLKGPDRISSLFIDFPVAVENNGWLEARCDYVPKAAKPMLPKFEVKGKTEEDYLHEISFNGLRKHLEKVDPDKYQIYYDRFDYEIGLIKSQGFSGYFLIVADFIEWSRSQGIPVGPGRGSGAGSIVAWSLGITKLDPIKMKLLFERFINPDRVSLPDFDIDFCEHRRDEVIRYVRHKYGSERVVAIGAYNTFQARMAVKDVGRILGQPHGLMDRISKALPTSGEITQEIINSPEMQEILTTEDSRTAMRLGAKLHGLIRNKTRHPAGIIIADRRIDEVMALEVDARDADVIVTQYDMKPVEEAGLVKFDFLGLKTLTVIEKTRKNLENHGIIIDPYEVPLDDKLTFTALSQGQTTGVFQLESGGITRACRDIRVDDFEDIVAIVALYRPGPMEFIPLYAKRKKGLEPFGTPHPLLDEVGRDTYGILVYQEQVMQAAQVLAGYTLGQADLLRRAMGKKIKAEMDAQREVFIEGCQNTNNIPKGQAQELFELIERFAMYGFNRSHAAAYGLLSYITSYLINNHTSAYLAAAMDGAADDNEQLVKLAQEARRRGIKLIPPEIDEEAGYFKSVDDKTIRWSLTAIRGLGHTAISALISASKTTKITSIEQLISLAGEHINRSQALSLAASGALDKIAIDRSSSVSLMRDQYDMLNNEAKSQKSGQSGLFDDHVEVNQMTDNSIDPKELLDMERNALGITLSSHPLRIYERLMIAEAILTPTIANELIELMPIKMAAQVDEVKINKGKGGWMNIRLSDEQAAFSVGCDESMKNAHLLTKGALVVLQISCYVAGGERRLRIDNIERLLNNEDEAKLAAPLVMIEVNDDFDRESLRSLIAEGSGGKSRMHILHNRRLTNTPPIINASDDVIKKLQDLPGVDNVIIQ